ncbi:MAG: RNA-binding protein [Bacteroidia bacterium]|nr:RNA-binding protein [Bacteroidia bacterium]
MRLRVSSIDSSISKANLQEVFEEVGEVASVRIFRSVKEGDPSLAFVEMKRERDALIAVNKLNGRILGKLSLKIEASNEFVKSNNSTGGKAAVPEDEDEEEDIILDDDDTEDEEETEEDDDNRSPSFDNSLSLDDIADEY